MRITLNRFWPFAILAIALLLWRLIFGVQDDRPLWEVTFHEDLKQMRFLLNNGTSIDQRDKFGNTALHWAMRAPKKRVQLAELLLAYGAQVDAHNQASSLPLHWVSTSETNEDSAALVDILVNAGADVNAVNAQKETALHWAVSFLQYDVVSSLLKHDANVNAVDAYGNAPMHKISVDCATNIECLQILNELIDNGGDFNIANMYGRKPLDQFNLTEATVLGFDISKLPAWMHTSKNDGSISGDGSSEADFSPSDDATGSREDL